MNDSKVIIINDRYGSIKTLVHLLCLATLSDLQNQGKEVKKEVTEDGTTVNKTEDVLIKVIRVIANLSINENVGPVICSNYQCVDFLLKVLGKASMLHLHHSLISIQICQCREI